MLEGQFQTGNHDTSSENQPFFCMLMFFSNKSSIDIQGWVENDVHPSTLGRPTRNFTAAEALLPLGKSCGRGKMGDLGDLGGWKKPAPVDDKIHLYPITIP